MTKYRQKLITGNPSFGIADTSTFTSPILFIKKNLNFCQFFFMTYIYNTFNIQSISIFYVTFSESNF